MKKLISNTLIFSIIHLKYEPPFCINASLKPLQKISFLCLCRLYYDHYNNPSIDVNKLPEPNFALHCFAQKRVNLIYLTTSPHLCLTSLSFLMIRPLTYPFLPLFWLHHAASLSLNIIPFSPPPSSSCVCTLKIRTEIKFSLDIFPFINHRKSLTETLS